MRNSRPARLGLSQLAAVLLVAIASNVGLANDDWSSFSATYPGITRIEEEGKTVAVFGRPMNEAATPERAAAEWFERYVSVFGLGSPELELQRTLPVQEGHATIVQLQQTVDGTAIEHAMARVVTRARDDRWVVTFVSARLVAEPKVEPVLITMEDALETARRQVADAGLDWAAPALSVSKPTPSTPDEAARRVWSVRARGADRNGLVAWNVLVDAASGEVVARRNELFHIDAAGTVTGFATLGSTPDVWSAPVDGPASTSLPQIKVSVVGDPDVFTYTDAMGDYFLSYPTPFSVEARLSGRYVDVVSTPDPDLLVTAPGSLGQSLIFNDAPVADQSTGTAQVNGYYYANRTIEFFVDHEPATAALFLGTRLNVAVDDPGPGCGGLGNFGLVGGVAQVNMAQAAPPTCPNASYATPICHETGHYVQAILSSVVYLQGFAFGEGVADTIATYVNDTPLIGEDHFCPGFFFRNADNTLQYPSTGQILDPGCGPTPSSDAYTHSQLLSGIWWSVKSELEAVENNGAQIAGGLLTRWLLTTIGVDVVATDVPVQPVALAEVLAVDEDMNLFLGDGTEHSDEIIDAFEAHGISIVLPQIPFVRGDIDGNGAVGSTDPFDLIDYLFDSGPAPVPCDAADVDDDGSITIGDLILLLNFAFSTGDAPNYPYPNEGLDPEPSVTGC